MRQSDSCLGNTYELFLHSTRWAGVLTYGTRRQFRCPRRNGVRAGRLWTSLGRCSHTGVGQVRRPRSALLNNRYIAAGTRRGRCWGWRLGRSVGGGFLRNERRRTSGRLQGFPAGGELDAFGPRLRECLLAQSTLRAFPNELGVHDLGARLRHGGRETGVGKYVNPADNSRQWVPNGRLDRAGSFEVGAA